MLHFDLFATVIVGKADRDLASSGRDQDVRRVWEGGTLLDVVVAYQPQATMLSKYSGFIVKRAILKAKNETRHYLISTGDLDEIACGKNFALHRAQCKKSVDSSLHVAHSHRFSLQQEGQEQNDPTEQAGNGPGPEALYQTMDDKSPCNFD